MNGSYHWNRYSSADTTAAAFFHAVAWASKASTTCTEAWAGTRAEQGRGLSLKARRQQARTVRENRYETDHDLRYWLSIPARFE
jgi:hypothetical protein